MTSEHVKLVFETVICGIKPDSPEIIKRKHLLARITLCLLHACLTCGLSSTLSSLTSKNQEDAGKD